MKFNPTKRTSEAMVQAAFYQACKEAGLNCFLEYQAKPDNAHRGRPRFDAVVHNGENILAIIEIKAYKTEIDRNKQNWLKTKQSAKYRSYGVPVFLVASLDDIEPTIKSIFFRERG